MSLQRLVINTSLTSAGFKSWCDLAPGQLPALNNFADYVGAVLGGNQSALFSFNVGAVQATGLVTFTGAPSADETVTICNVVFTAKASGATGNQFNIGGSITATALNLATAINASSSLSGIVTASPNVGVVTLTAVVPGTMGNGLGLSETLSNATVTAFSGGTDGTAYSIDLR